MAHAAHTGTNFAQSPGRTVALAAQIRAGELTPRDLVARCLERIHACDGAVAAWVSVDADGALAAADRLGAEAQAGAFRGPLHGIPVGVKDIIDVAGWPTRCNSPTRQNAPPATADAAVVAALRTAGAIILGKTQTTEFAFYHASPARNPHNVNHTPGGSSSGSAAALAAGMVPAALGTQTVASVNRPAAYCGIGGFKPSSGVGGSHGVAPLAPLFDTVGFYGATVADAVALFEATCPAYLAPPAIADGTPARVIVLEDPLFEESDAAVLAARDRIAEMLAGAGHEVVRMTSPVALTELGQQQSNATEYELARVHAGLLDAPIGDVSDKLREAIEAGSQRREEDYIALRRAFVAARHDMFADCGPRDVILMPATPKTAPEGLEWTGDRRFIGPWTALGGPIVTLPAGFDAAGLPIGCLLAGRPGEDRDFARLACRLAEAIEDTA